MVDEYGKTHFAEQEVGWYKENNRKPPIMYYIGHPNHWNTWKFSNLVVELKERTDWPESTIMDVLTDTGFPVQNPKEKNTVDG